MKFTRKFLVGALLAVVPLAAVHAQLGRTVDAGGGLYLQQSFDQALIREPSGKVSELALPQGASVYRLERLGTGWIVSGGIDALSYADVFLMRSDDGVPTPVPTPPNHLDHRLRGNPVPLVQAGELVGLAWVSGPRVREYAVYASLWSGVDWSPPELVSAPGPGTQIGLAGAVLADGSWLLLWSAYDGNDDEIVWSRRVDGRWSSPGPIHVPDEKPDVVPSVIATGRGALAAWSSSNGRTYRVKLAAFEAGRWRELGFGGPAGSFHPTLTAADRSIRMLYRTAVPASWTLRELDERGRSLRTAVVPTESTFRPGTATLDGSTPVLEWPGAEAATPFRVEAEWKPEP